LEDGNGEIIYHPRQQLIYSNLTQENNLAAAQYEDGNHVEDFQGQQRLVTVKTVGYTGWKIIAVTPTADITSNYYEMKIFALFFVFFAIFLLIFVNMFLSSRIANPIKELEHSVKDIEKGKLSDVAITVSNSGSYEVQHLANTIRSMVNQMRNLMDDIVMEQESKRKSELDALQSQINPHFLYNTLDSI
ncbi:histidine kinase, partial [Clostridium sp. 2-1]|uniref:histidine kinase n=1 Tax=Clostridium sp. 2-1 TaxID=2070758 RepID=UPI001FA8513E